MQKENFLMWMTLLLMAYTISYGHKLHHFKEKSISPCRKPITQVIY